MAIPTGTAPMNDFAEAGVPITLANGTVAYAMMVVGVDSSGTVVAGGGTLPAGTNDSGTATTTASTLAAANPGRTFLVGQNIGANNIWINEIGGTAAANTAGSYKVIPGNSFSISTNRAISVIAETGSTAYTATEG